MNWSMLFEYTALSYRMKWKDHLERGEDLDKNIAVMILRMCMESD
jgi:hypothetical protein